MSSPHNGKLPSEHLEHMSHCGSPNNGESIEDLLKQLQYRVDIADNVKEPPFQVFFYTVVKLKKKF